MRLSTPFFVMIFLAIACSTESGGFKKKETKKESEVVRDGVSRLYYPDGKLRAEVPMKEGKKNGLATEYYNTGKKHLEINYVEGRNEGLTTRYWETGNLYEQTNYQRGEMHGTRKRYRKDGKLSSEATYNQGFPCLGLKEYLVDGKPKKNFPTIVIQPVDLLLKEHKYVLRLKMSDNAKNVTYYVGPLEGNCLSDALRELPKTNMAGVGEITYFMIPGGFVMEEINVVAKVKTAQGNFFVTQRKYNVAIEYN